MAKTAHQPGTLRHWLGGVRLYIAIAAGLISLLGWWWAQRMYGDSPALLSSRLHELYGWLAVGCLFVALAIGPVCRLVPRLGANGLLRDARRLVGVSAAWFASLHAGIAYFISFQAVNPLQLTTVYRRGFLFGALAIIVLWALAFTSFNGAMRSLGVWWFRLHRLIYIGVPLAIWHAFTIGVHATIMPALAIVIVCGLVLFLAQLQVVLIQPKAVSKWQVLTLCIMGLTVIILSNYGLQLYIDSNSQQGHLH